MVVYRNGALGRYIRMVRIWRGATVDVAAFRTLDDGPSRRLQAPLITGSLRLRNQDDKGYLCHSRPAVRRPNLKNLKLTVPVIGPCFRVGTRPGRAS